MSVSSFKSGRSGSSRSEVRPASSPNSSRAIPCSVCRRPDHHPTPLNPELHQASSSGAALIAPLRALGVSIGQSASPRMNVLYSDAGSERSRRSEGGDNHHSRGPAADGPRVSNGGSTRALEQDVASVRIAHCSWCLAECAHAQVSEGFLLFRAAYRCGGCARRTLPCRRSGCAAHARGDAGKDDDLCIVHRAVVPAWPSGTDTKYDAWLVDRLHPKARCSWCLDVKRHSLESVDAGGKETFACGGCARRTVRCDTCTSDVANNTPGAKENYGLAKGGDRQCARCLGIVYDWRAPQAVNASLHRTEGWCSWCGERCAHLVRDKTRTRCQCLVCGGGTAPCDLCPGVMRTRERPRMPTAGAGRGDQLGRSNIGKSTGACLRCEVVRASPGADEAAAVWEMVQTRRAAADAAAAHVRDVLQRRSRWSQRAQERGAWRPFALLATLPPRERVRIAMRLGIRLCRERGYLDPHAEAWRVLATPGKGILARAAGGVDALKGLKATVRRASEDDSSPDASLDADAGASVIGSVLRRIGRDIAEAAGAVRPDAARANWLETLASVLTAGAETGSCPASDPREICNLPAVAGGRVGALKILKTPRALVVARYEEATLGAVAGAQRARLTPAQRLAVDALATHPQRRVLETRLKRSGSDYKRMADAAVLSAFAASPWASFGHIGDVPLEADEAESVAADVYGCLLDGRAPTGPTGRNAKKQKHWAGLDAKDDANDTDGGVAPSLLASLASEGGTVRGALLGPLVSFGFNASGAMSQQDVSDASLGIRPPASVQKGPAGLFEPIAVLLVHGALLASRGVHIDDCHPGREAYARKLERANARAGAGRGGRRMSDGTGSARSSTGRPPRYAESELSDSPVGVITASYGGSSRGSEERRVGAWAEEQATAPAPFGPVSGSEITVEEEDFHDADDDLPEPPSPVPRHFSRKAPAFAPAPAPATAGESLPTSHRPGGAGAFDGKGNGKVFASPDFAAAPRTMTGDASRFVSAGADAEIDEWLEDTI